MPQIKAKEIREMNKEEREKRLKELKLELIRSKGSSQKTGSSKIKEIKKIIAKIITINNEEALNAKAKVDKTTSKHGNMS